MSRKIISMLLATVFTISLVTVEVSAEERELEVTKKLNLPNFLNVTESPNLNDSNITLDEAISLGNVRDLVIHSEDNKVSAFSIGESLREGELNNLVIYTKFKGENEFLSESFKGTNINTVFNNMYNKSNISVKEYYNQLSLNKLNLQTSFIGSNADAGLSIELDNERGYYKPYSDDNKIGYFEYTVIDANTYEFIANMYESSVADTDPSDGVVTQHYLEQNDNAGYVVNEYDSIYREKKLIYEIAEKANTAGISNINLDSDNNSYIDAATILIGVTPDNKIASEIGWSELLWPHQTSMPYGVPQEEIDELKYIFNLDFSFLNEGESEISNASIDKYNLFTSDFLLDDIYDVDSNLGKVGDVGTICHELAHTLDLPDLYSYVNQDLLCVGKWDLMEATGVVPQFVNSYLRKEAGWLTDNQMPVIDKDGEYELKAICNVGSEDIAGYIIKLPGYEDQFFFVEYRKDEGSFDGATAYHNGQESKNIFESGIVIYRVDLSVPNEHGMLMAGNFNAPPYNIYTFRDEDMSSPADILLSAINGVNETSYGSIDPNVTKNALTFQDSNGGVVENSRVIIDNVNVSGDKIKFTVDAKDPATKDIKIVDNKILVSFDEKINSGADFNSISLLKDGNKQDIKAEIVEDNKVEISLSNGNLSGEYIVNIPQKAIIDVVGKSMLTDFTGAVNAGEEETVINVTDVVLNKTEVVLKVGENVQLNSTVNPENATNKNVVWTSNNEAVAKVDENGKVTAISVGEANITVTTVDGNKTASCKVVVTAQEVEEPTVVEVTGVELDKTEATVKEGDTLQLNATVKPENATNKKVTWASSNNDVATVDSNGKVVAVKAGEAVITVKTEAGDYMAICKLKVEKKAGTTTVTPETNTTVTTKPNTEGKSQLVQTGKESPVVAIGILSLLSGILFIFKNKKN